MSTLQSRAECGPNDNRRIRMIYEMRSYRAMPGRLPDLLKRFDTITLKLFEKHGIKQGGFWVTEVGESNHNLIYFCVYESMADREKKWGAFSSDPEWHAKRAETEKNGPLVQSFSNQFLKPTTFSAAK
jgi:NIPSNAP